MDVTVLPDASALAHAAAGVIARLARRAVARRGRFVLAVSGGTTPDAMFDALCDEDVPWSSVVLHQVDERITADGSPHRNATHLDQHLLAPLRRKGATVGTVRLLPVAAADDPALLASAADDVRADRPFDLVHLGLGEDGHTASWPPGDPVVTGTRGPLAVTAEFNGFRRLTLTPRVVAGARRRLVVVSGSGKAGAVERWLLRDGSVPIHHVPARRTLVMLDADAAGSVAAWTVPR